MRWIAAVAVLVFLCPPAPAQTKGKQPNILWITCEDIGPHLGCYGDKVARTPNLDKLAKKGIIYLHAWSCAPVCAPARTTIISGLYPTSTGSEHMRSMTRLPANMAMFPALLRRAGYYCTNHIKEDYNLEKTGQVWDVSSKDAHPKNRNAGQPFFAVFNFLVTHESQIRKKPHVLKTDPAQVKLPSYHPDTPEVRHDWAQYYDNIASMDEEVGRLLRELEEAGLLEDTIIIFFADHGSGMPRSKRTACNSGLHVPMVVHFPAALKDLAPRDYAPGGKSSRLVSFIDLAPTMLSLAGIEPPGWMQGRAFLGQHTAAEPEFLFGFRGRMDERQDLVRSARDRRYVYVRNYLPHLPHGQHVAYMFETPTTRVWRELFEAGKLTPPQRAYWQPRVPEELYDIETDSEEVRNLADSPMHKEILKRLRQAQRDWILKVRDVGFLPEGEIRSRSKGSNPYDMGHDKQKYPLEKVLDMAEIASWSSPYTVPRLLDGLTDVDSAVRYWAAQGLLMDGRLARALEDTSPHVRIVAAEALARHGSDTDLKKALPVLLDLADLSKHGLYVSVSALNALDRVGPKAASVRAAIEALPTTDPSVSPRMKDYNKNLVKHILSQLK
jgi:uncharacterized sulfatase